MDRATFPASIRAGERHAADGVPGVSTFVESVSRRLTRWLDRLALMSQVRAERAILASMGDRDLQDIGIDRATALDESARGYFDLPAERLRDRM